jgi:hypothetical protein
MSMIDMRSIDTPMGNNRAVSSGTTRAIDAAGADYGVSFDTEAITEPTARIAATVVMIARFISNLLQKSPYSSLNWRTRPAPCRP